MNTLTTYSCRELAASAALLRARSRAAMPNPEPPMPPREPAPRPGTRRTRTPPPDGIWGRRRAPKSARGQKVRQTSGPAPKIRRNADQPENPADAPDDVPEVRTGFRPVPRHTFDGGQFKRPVRRRRCAQSRRASRRRKPPQPERRQKARPVRRQGRPG